MKLEHTANCISDCKRVGRERQEAATMPRWHDSMVAACVERVLSGAVSGGEQKGEARGECGGTRRGEERRACRRCAV